MAVATAAVLLGLTGCASLSGSAAPVLSVKSRLDAAKLVNEATALHEFESPLPGARGGLTRRGYRNMVAGIYMSAADARYESYLRSLSREVRGTSLGGNLAILIMNGVAVVSGAEGARALAAGSAVVAGSQGALSKDVFYGQTLTAVLATMDGNRSQSIGNLQNKLQLGADTYSLEMALADIRDVERQANLDTALKQLVSLASVDAAQKKATMQIAYAAPLLGKIVTKRTVDLQDYIDGLIVAEPDKLGKIAEALHAPTDPDPTKQAKILDNWLAQYVVSESTFDEVTQKLKPVTGKEAYP